MNDSGAIRKDRSKLNLSIYLRAYYISSFFFCLQNIPFLKNYSFKKDVLLLWPVKWIPFVDLEFAINFICVAVVVAGLFASLKPFQQTFRIIHFFAYFSLNAY